MTRPWSDAPLRVDFVIVKMGPQGPSFSVAKATRIVKAFDGADPYLEEIFPVIAEYPLPDGSRGAPLRVREAAMQIDGLVFTPRRLLDTGRLEVLDVGAIRVRHLIVTEDDLREFLRAQPVDDVRVRLDEGGADVRLSRLGPLISARVRLISPAAENAFALVADRVRIGSIRVPDFLTSWIVCQFDPMPALRRLPIRVELEPNQMKLGRIEIGP